MDNNNRNNDERFGFSLALDKGDLLFAGEQLVMVAGVRNLQQALVLRILTPFGSDIFNTTYGLDVKQAFTQGGGLRLTKELIKLNLVRALGTDPRVRDIREILFEDDPTYLARHPELTAKAIRNQRHSRIWTVEVTVDTVDGQTQVLPITIGV